MVRAFGLKFRCHSLYYRDNCRSNSLPSTSDVQKFRRECQDQRRHKEAGRNCVEPIELTTADAVRHLFATIATKNKLLNAFVSFKDEIRRFAKRGEAPFSNDRTEREVRMAKLRKKNLRRLSKRRLRPKLLPNFKLPAVDVTSRLQFARRHAKRLERRCDGNVRPIPINFFREASLKRARRISEPFRCGIGTLCSTI